ncbi:MAG: response regulator [Saprospiraceae bacterium]
MNTLKKKILIIEDQDSIRLLLGAMLRKNYEVVTKKDGLEGMAWMVKGNIPDLILLDMSMPRLSGGDFLKNIRRSGYFRDVPVIVVSGNDEKEDIQMAQALGAKHYLTKPFNPIRLQEKISHVLALREEVALN